MNSNFQKSSLKGDSKPSKRMVFAWEEERRGIEEYRRSPRDPGSAIDSEGRMERIRGAGLLAAINRFFSRFDARVDRYLPESLNPLARTGAIANTCLLIAVVTGILLLFWYSPSVRSAYDSMEALREGSPLGQFVRSLHRYSSDACMLFILLHVVRVFVALKFTGARSLAWVSGFVLLAVIWLIGWTGYWLVWDERGQQVALGTVRFFSFLPFLGDPLARSFLTNETVPSLLFFLVFFTHMLLPLAVAFLLWLHLSRVSRPKLLTGKVMTFWILGTLAVLSILMPAESAGRADLAARPGGFDMDWWYLWPLVLTDRLGGGMLWAVSFIGVVALCGVPWWLVKRPQKRWAARVDENACQGCTLCSKDCPFDAIRMVERDGTGNGPRLMAEVDPNRCVSCGICTGACDSDAIAMPGLEIAREKQAIAAWIEARKAEGKDAFLAYVCGETSSGLKIDTAARQSKALRGYRLLEVPCAGWVSATLLEYAQQKGAAGILVIGCRSSEARFREGADWLEARLDGKRKPFLRPRKAERKRVRFLRVNPGDEEEVLREAAGFRDEQSVRSHSRKGPVAACLVGLMLAGGLALATWAGSDAPYVSPEAPPELLVSLRHEGELMEEIRRFSEEELERLPRHMRAETTSGGSRSPVVLRVYANDQLLLEREYRARGLRRSGPSTALERIRLPEGRNELRVLVNDTGEAGNWPHEWNTELEVEAGDRPVLTFGSDGFELN